MRRGWRQIPAATWFAACAALPLAAVAEEQPAVIKTGQATSALTERDLDHPLWDKAPATTVQLATAFPGHPSIVGTALTPNAEVKALRTATGLLVRLEWVDAEADARLETARFADGAALQFPRSGKASTAPFMGGGGQTVNIWYWNAARNSAENLMADGFGTLARLPVQDVRAYGRHADGKWRVVFFRAWRSPEPQAAALFKAAGARQPIAFAVWNGQNQERDGFKAVTLAWQTLQF